MVITTGGATRGLAEDERQRPGDITRQSYAAVKKMETLDIDDGTVLTFLKAGVDR